MRAGEPVAQDHARLSALVARHFPGSQLVGAERLAGGVAAEVSRLDIRLPDGAIRKLVLREHGPGYPGLGVEHEYALLAALDGAGLPVPTPIAAEAGRADISNPYVLLEFIEGSTELPPELGKRSVVAMAEHLRAIHNAPTERLPSLPRRVDPVPELLEWLAEGEDATGLVARLNQLGDTAHSGEPTLLHGDFWPNNVVWQDRQLVAVLDWEDAAIGDPLSDVACTSLELRYVFGKSGETAFRSAYARHRAIDPFRFALWQAYVAVAGCRSMGDWGLDPAREAHMRRVADGVIREAAAILS